MIKLLFFSAELFLTELYEAKEFSIIEQRLLGQTITRPFGVQTALFQADRYCLYYTIPNPHLKEGGRLLWAEINGASCESPGRVRKLEELSPVEDFSF